MSFLVAAGLGYGLGVVTGMPLGVVNVAIADAAAAGRRRFAIGLGVGGAVADTAHAAIAFGGLGHVVTARPELVRGLALAAAALIVGYALFAWRLRPIHRPQADESRASRGVAAGALLTLPNPGALAAWVAVAAALWPDATLAEALAIAAGVGAGAVTWGVLLARVVSRVPPGHRALRIIPRAALIVLLGIAAYGVTTAARAGCS